ncbi:hypothetical protein BDN72DRAFT_863499 [Pluteus cervinus]|uniref:Uncharacterized protein n=1 Tax=Pluteus cervinus TaxID=181527 RepID=A0ACD3A771_9AGAR|nr:hypothetical protein BDN72DRAFT_863499 [Pluteus cervinus]
MYTPPPQTSSKTICKSSGHGRGPLAEELMEQPAMSNVTRRALQSLPNKIPDENMVLNELLSDNLQHNKRKKAISQLSKSEIDDPPEQHMIWHFCQIVLKDHPQRGFPICVQHGLNITCGDRIRQRLYWADYLGKMKTSDQYHREQSTSRRLTTCFHDWLWHKNKVMMYTKRNSQKYRQEIEPEDEENRDEDEDEVIMWLRTRGLSTPRSAAAGSDPFPSQISLIHCDGYEIRIPSPGNDFQESSLVIEYAVTLSDKWRHPLPPIKGESMTHIPTPSWRLLPIQNASICAPSAASLDHTADNLTGGPLLLGTCPSVKWALMFLFGTALRG